MKITVSLPPHTLMLGDCLERMKEIPDGSVDMVMCDLPYGTTNCRWDSVIPFDPLWLQYKRVIKKRGAIVLTGAQPFTSALVMSNPTWFKWEDIWHKSKPSGQLNANVMPLREHENILVFGKGGVNYNPQFSKKENPRKPQKSKNSDCFGDFDEGVFRTMPDDVAYPRSVIKSNTAYHERTSGLHPTQKPVGLMEYLILTYANDGETVLDNCFGSASTGIACINTGRRFIGVEKDPHFFEVGRHRMEEAMRQAAQPAPQGGLFDSQAAE